MESIDLAEVPLQFAHNGEAKLARGASQSNVLPDAVQALFSLLSLGLQLAFQLISLTLRARKRLGEQTLHDVTSTRN